MRKPSAKYPEGGGQRQTTAPPLCPGMPKPSLKHQRAVFVKSERKQDRACHRTPPSVARKHMSSFLFVCACIWMRAPGLQGQTTRPQDYRGKHSERWVSLSPPPPALGYGSFYKFSRAVVVDTKKYRSHYDVVTTVWHHLVFWGGGGWACGVRGITAQYIKGVPWCLPSYSTCATQRVWLFVDSAHLGRTADHTFESRNTDQEINRREHSPLKAASRNV